MTHQEFIEKIKSDREAGTLGDWRIEKAPYTDDSAWAEEFWLYGPDGPAGRNSFAEFRYGCGEARDEGDLASNAYRVARVPQLEEVAIAAFELLDSLEALISESEGISGLHLNGDLAPWSELTAGGPFEEWLIAIDKLREAVQ